MISDDLVYYFEHSDVMNAVFASSITQNIKRVEEALQIHLTARDCWIKIETESEKKRQTAFSFFKELTHLHQLYKRDFNQHDFDHLLQIYQKGGQNEFQQCFHERIKVSPRKKDIIPRNFAQLEYIRLLRTKDITFGIGPAGTGKTYLAMAVAVSELLEGRVSRLILTRPAKEAGENLGFLPGTLEEKIMPYLRPLYDALYDMMSAEEVQQFFERKTIEVAPLAFMRGRTLNNAFIILDEAQNTTVDQMLMFLTRLGFDSRCVVTGDPMQSDLAVNQPSGLLHAINTLQSISELGFAKFSTQDIVRHPVVEKIINAYQGA